MLRRAESWNADCTDGIDVVRPQGVAWRDVELMWLYGARSAEVRGPTLQEATARLEAAATRSETK